jgi:hypothetical protein
MPYPNHVEVNSLTGEITETSVTNEWVLATKPNHYRLSTDKAQVVANGVDFATITIQRVSPPLIDDSQPDVPGTGTVLILVGDEPAQPATLDISGEGKIGIPVTELGAFKVRLSDAYAADNEIELEGI